jgi:hypothetical protein
LDRIDEIVNRRQVVDGDGVVALHGSLHWKLVAVTSLWQCPCQLQKGF